MCKFGSRNLSSSQMFYESVLNVNICLMKKKTRIPKILLIVLIAWFLAHLMNHIDIGIVALLLLIISEEFKLHYSITGAVANTTIITLDSSHFRIGFLVIRGWGNIITASTILCLAIPALLESIADLFRSMNLNYSDIVNGVIECLK